VSRTNLFQLRRSGAGDGRLAVAPRSSAPAQKPHTSFSPEILTFDADTAEEKTQEIAGPQRPARTQSRLSVFGVRMPPTSPGACPGAAKKNDAPPVPVPTSAIEAPWARLRDVYVRRFLKRSFQWSPKRGHPRPPIHRGPCPRMARRILNRAGAVLRPLLSRHQRLSVFDSAAPDVAATNPRFWPGISLFGKRGDREVVCCTWPESQGPHPSTTCAAEWLPSYVPAQSTRRQLRKNIEEPTQRPIWLCRDRAAAALAP